MKMSHKSIKKLFEHPPSEAKRAATIDEKLEKKERLKMKILDWKEKKRKKEEDVITVEAEGMDKHEMTTREGDKIKELEQDVTKKPEIKPDGNQIMMAAHTPLLGTHKSVVNGMSSLHIPRAGIIQEWQGRDTTNCVQSDNTPDMRKATKNHRSPNLEINLSRSPMMINGRVELFGEMSDMIRYWEERERGGEEPSELGGNRRSSKRIEELCEIYEGGGDSDQYNHPEIGGGGGGRGDTVLLASKEKAGNNESFPKTEISFGRNPEPGHEHLPLERLSCRK